MMKLQEGIDFLADGGLNLLAVLDCADLPEDAARMMMASGVPLADYGRLVLAGHGGRRMWAALQEWGMRTDDPVDYYSMSQTRQFVDEYLDGAPVLWLYPGADEFVIPLQQLGEAAGWSYPSLLGSGISSVYGVWFAYRAAFLIDVDLPVVHEGPGPSPCAGCLDKPCISACPVGAVREDVFGIDACVGQRLALNSTCVDRCLARLACPFFPEHRYTMAQVQYHYGRSLRTLRAWQGNEII